MYKIGVFIFLMVALTSNGYAHKCNDENYKKLTADYPISGKGNVDSKRLRKSFELFEKMVKTRKTDTFIGKTAADFTIFRQLIQSLNAMLQQIPKEPVCIKNIRVNKHNVSSIFFSSKTHPKDKMVLKMDENFEYLSLEKVKFVVNGMIKLKRDTVKVSIIQTKKIIPFHLIDGLILIDAEVNGVKGKIMFDTATKFDFIFNDERISLDTTNVVARGAAGSGQPIVVYNSNEKTTIRLAGWGESIVQNNNFHTQLEFISEGFDTNLIGTMGFDFLKNYEFTINYDTQLITLYPIDEKGNRLVEKSKPSLPNSFVLHFHNENEKHIPEVDVDVCGLKIPAHFDTGDRGVVRFSEKTYQSLKQRECIEEIKGFRYGVKGDYTIMQLQDISILGKSVGKLNNILLKLNKEDDDFGLGYPFLKKYISVWNYKKKTIELIKEE